MDTIVPILNAVMTGLLAIVLIVAILHPGVNDGIVIKVGMIGMALGFGAIALIMLDGIQPGDRTRIQRGLLMVCSGIAVVILGYAWRCRRCKHPLRRRTDFGDLR